MMLYGFHVMMTQSVSAVAAWHSFIYVPIGYPFLTVLIVLHTHLAGGKQHTY